MSESRRHLADAQRIVVKLGTHVVTNDGVELAQGRLTDIVEGVARLRRAGREVVMVSSGAVTMGARALGLAEPPRSLGLRQACAAVGQGHLMGVYTQAFAKLGLAAASAGEASGAGAGAARTGFGDNDGLSARVAVSLDADLLVMLTNVAGLFTTNPRVDASAVRIAELAGID